jgi:hypothetical protein
MDEMKCPECDNTNVVPILYGYPNAKGIEDVKAGKMVLGGCIVRGNDPKHYCKDCKTKF